MKRLPQYYLANYMGLEPVERRIALRKFCETSAGYWGYGAFNLCTSEILGAETGFLGKLDPVSDAQVEQLIRSSCTSGSGHEFTSNLQVAKALIQYVKSREITARYFEMPSARFGAGEFLRYWNDLIVEIDGERFVLCIDPKLNGLTSKGMHIVRSIAQVQIIEGLPKLAGFKPAVLYFPKSDSGKRYAMLRKSSSDEFHSYDELHRRYVETYSQYADVLEEIRKESDGSGATGTLI
ncbi:hypothetical protein [Hyphomonas oceanitis]|uniref:Uncharacterized protein n=1 Tax=Hyphomonas oceanitis SCH89 TaxID=1280953 RepID=A0A059G1E5_9PROT|nr:hypothetical protein [Hyphomonas oceanitis]KCZ99318.1 hypothetical protein HOC_19951 [Hyphomonas oceanitis SCH89]